MAFVVPDVGEVELLKYITNFAPATNVRLHLYVNNITPSESDVLSNYTESSAAGYASVVLTGSQFTIATSFGTSSAVYARQTYSYSTSESAYGYYITDNSTTVLLMAERFTGAPFNIPSTGGTIQVDPKITLQ